MLLSNIRKSFLDYFELHDHKILTSSPLVPYNDPSLLFTNAGMVQFKNQFTGKEKVTHNKVTTSQKCIRAGGKHNDLENVGHTARHHTFFEMLGNFSFGDYFKEKAIFYSWYYLTRELQISKENLYITVYHEDDEAFQLWKKITGFSDDKIIKIKTDDNFWSMGDVGPCGSCSEIFYDHGKKYFGDLPGTKDEDGDRYVEIWNLVFMQFEKLASGKQINLANQSIDTGMGLERITAVMQGVNNNYDTDLFQTLIKASMEISGNNKEIVSHRILADHIRSSCFLLADGVIPSNEGRGYVLRRIMRRAIRHVHNLGYNGLMLHKLAPTLINLMNDAYPELTRAKEMITSVLQVEEEKFKETLSKGLKYLNQEIATIEKGKVFDGKKAFKLYDTYGFPIDITSDILKKKQIPLDQNAFKTAMEEQKRRARLAWVGSGDEDQSSTWFDIYEKFGATEFIRKDSTHFSGKILAIIKDNKLIEVANPRDKVIIITDQTPFYAESGGQVGDKGTMNISAVYDTKLFVGKLHGHFVKAVEKFAVNDEVQLAINYKIRNKIKANHSATHLLHHALRSTLGNHVMQKGSLVNAEKLRFDFTHNKALNSEELSKIEELVNRMVISNKAVAVRLMDIKSAQNIGAIALFGEKYDNEVRVISMGESVELCCGTHIKQLGDIGYFVIKSEDSIAAGIRRIEAYTGEQAVTFARDKLNKLDDVQRLLKCSTTDLTKNIKELQGNVKELQRRYENYQIHHLSSCAKKSKVADINILTLVLKERNVDLKKLYDHLKNNNENSVVTIVNTNESNHQSTILIGVTKGLENKYNAKEIIEKCLAIIDGKGGGNKEVAQASGKKINIEAKIFEVITQQIDNNYYFQQQY
jgi:alanyl-tRNA synthetase